MIEKIFKMSNNNESVIEPIIQDENIHYMHMVFKRNEKLRTHYANANVYMTVREGVLSISLDDGPFNKYVKNTVLKIPYNTKMDVQNHDETTLEIIVVKSPSPGNPIYNN